jgi:hypothetical protein
MGALKPAFLAYSVTIYGIKKDQMRMISFNIHSHLIFFITLFLHTDDSKHVCNGT